jgi:hypothetical protein
MYSTKNVSQHGVMFYKNVIFIGTAALSSGGGVRRHERSESSNVCYTGFSKVCTSEIYVLQNR